MTTGTTRAQSGFVRHAWTIFVGLGALMILNGVGDMFAGPLILNGVGDLSDVRELTNLNHENSLNELLIGLFGVAIAVYGLRRGERWAWYAMLLWPLWTIAQEVRAWPSAYMGGDANSILTTAFLAFPVLAGPVFLILIVAAMALSCRAVFSKNIRR